MTCTYLPEISWYHILRRTTSGTKFPLFSPQSLEGSFVDLALVELAVREAANERSTSIQAETAQVISASPAAPAAATDAVMREDTNQRNPDPIKVCSTLLCCAVNSARDEFAALSNYRLTRIQMHGTIDL